MKWSLVANSASRLRSWKSVCLLLGGAAILSSTGCSRGYWRKQVDHDSYQAITEKLNDPRWAVPRIDTAADPRSRFYSPYNPDAEPLPPDDGAAGVYMDWVDGWHGYKGWHKFGESLTVENPQWLANFGWTVDNIDPLTGEIVPPLPELSDVTLPQAVELAQFNNRDYQTQIENVYLAALRVTFQRFQFGVRFLGANGAEPSLNNQSTFFPGRGGGNTFTSGFGGGVSQVLPAGTQWAVDFANNTLWLFSGGNSTSSVSNLSFSIVQPLLFGAGRKVGLEGLTQSERNLLYEARILARTRQEIFSDVVGGSPGFLTLLQQMQVIRNLQGNIAQFEEQVERMQARASAGRQFNNVSLERWPDGEFSVDKLPPELQGVVTYWPLSKLMRWQSDTWITERQAQLLQNISTDPVFQSAANQLINELQRDTATLDVLKLQSSLQSNMVSLRSQEIQLENDFDNFKILLGLRTDTRLTIDNSLLKQFEIIDAQVQELEAFGNEFIQRGAELLEQGDSVESYRQLYVEALQLLDTVTRVGLGSVEEDMQKIQAAIPRRQQELSPEQFTQFGADVQRSRESFERVKEEIAVIRANLVQDAQSLRNLDLQPDNFREISKVFNDQRDKLIKAIRNLLVIQVTLRVELIELQPFQMALQHAVETGLDNRVDLMNERAFVMDARRKVEIAANALLANLSIVVDGDISTPGNNRPFDFRGRETRLRAGIAFTAPLDQIDERNAYRETQIAYQRQRRTYMLAEDRVKQQIRNAWRQLFVLRQNMELSRSSVRLAALQYDAAVEESNAVSSGRGTGVSGTNLQQALSTLLSAQNQMIQIWTNYERNRLNLYRDMGIMEIDEDGMWVDPFYRSLFNAETPIDESPLGPILDMDGGRDPDFGDGGSRISERVFGD